jgi:hypothetical protein
MSENGFTDSGLGKETVSQCHWPVVKIYSHNRQANAEESLAHKYSQKKDFSLRSK